MAEWPPMVLRIPPMKHVMRSFPHTVDLEASLTAAQKLMRDNEIRHLPVKDAAGELVGVLTDRDIRLAMGSDAEAPLDPALKVGQVCVLGVYAVDLAEPLDEVLTQMAQRRIDSALVTKDGRLAGIFTLVDACRLFAQMLRAQFPAGDGAA